MRIIFSRKGFDSASDGCPSPILEDGRMVSLPIPDRNSPVSYGELEGGGMNLGALVHALTRGRYGARTGAHLDPDLRLEACHREYAWRPALGQCNAAQGHLRNQGVMPGDLFLFFGLFRELDRDLQFRGPPRHVIWGWMQVDRIASVENDVRPALDTPLWRWARHHPHLSPGPRRQNTLYVATDRLSLPGPLQGVAGAGVFPRFQSALQLTAADAASVTTWSLPRWFYPRDSTPLSFHADLERWRLVGDRTVLRTVGRGQEFVLDASVYPEAILWAASLIAIA